MREWKSTTENFKLQCLHSGTARDIDANYEFIINAAYLATRRHSPIIMAT
jgi:hypothetical protein